MNGLLFVVTQRINLSSQTRIIGAVVAILFLTFIVELVRRHRLEERYTIAWFMFGAALLVTVIFPVTMRWVAEALGISDTTSALLALVLLACLVLLLNLTVVISRLHAQSMRLAQDLALERASRQADIIQMSEVDEENVCMSPQSTDHIRVDHQEQVNEVRDS